MGSSPGRRHPRRSMGPRGRFLHRPRTAPAAPRADDARVVRKGGRARGRRGGRRRGGGGGSLPPAARVRAARARDAHRRRVQRHFAPARDDPPDPRRRGRGERRRATPDARGVVHHVRDGGGEVAHRRSRQSSRAVGGRAHRHGRGRGPRQHERGLDAVPFSGVRLTIPVRRRSGEVPSGARVIHPPTPPRRFQNHRSAPGPMGDKFPSKTRDATAQT